jgi:MFS family permease
MRRSAGPGAARFAPGSPGAAVRQVPGSPGGPRAAGALALVCLAMFAVYLDTTITPVALPAIRASLHAGVTAAQWVLDAYVLAFACLLLTAGSVGDILGRARVFLGALAGFAAASAGCALARTAGEPSTTSSTST